jgi:DnaJ-class molecular chaperone
MTNRKWCRCANESRPASQCYDCGDDDAGSNECPTCKGRGTVNPLTAPEGFFCVSTIDCPTCDGTGECP